MLDNYKNSSRYVGESLQIDEKNLLCKSNKRVGEIDFAKGILIMLMVLFHLTNFTRNYEILTQWVYAFHMSGFLLLSGYLLNINKTKLEFLKSVAAILYPYIFFEFIYLSAVSILGKTMESSNQFTLSIYSLIQNIVLSPIGTYWYLHTLIICMLVYFFINRLKICNFNILVFTGCVLYIFSVLIPGLRWENIIYFLIGCCIKKYGLQLKDVIYPSVLSVVPILLISIFCRNFYRSDLSGLGLTIFVLSFCMGIYNYVHSHIGKFYRWLGRNSLAIVLFSPLFTVFTKIYISLFSFDGTIILWAIFSLTIVIGLCLICAWVCDKIGVSKLLISKNMYSNYE